MSEVVNKIERKLESAQGKFMATNGLAMKVKEFETEEMKESPHQKRLDGTASTNAKTPMTGDNSRMDTSFVTETPH